MKIKLPKAKTLYMPPNELMLPLAKNTVISFTN